MADSLALPDGLSVLLVEDDPTNRLVALSMLRHIGIEADAVVNGQLGVQAATSKSYDVVLMDIQMPVMDGIEALRAIRALLPPDECPRIVAVTAHAVSGTRERMLATGFDDFYNKPLSIAMLREALSPPPLAEPALMIRPRSGHDEDDLAASLRNDVRAHVRALLGEDDEEFVVDLVDSFVTSSEDAVVEATTAYQGADWGTLASAAHKLKGSASNVGLGALATSWDHVEVAVRDAGQAPQDVVEAAMAETKQAITLLQS
ncbi:response regulator [Rubrivirga sp.]|uniref:response regulator n=1 Tax=Rubrivirga sp. TaxID=1885344 RepID=UPI003C76BF29